MEKLRLCTCSSSSDSFAVRTSLCAIRSATSCSLLHTVSFSSAINLKETKRGKGVRDRVTEYQNFKTIPELTAAIMFIVSAVMFTCSSQPSHHAVPWQTSFHFPPAFPSSSSFLGPNSAGSPSQPEKPFFLLHFLPIEPPESIKKQ